MGRLSQALNIDELAALARKRLPKGRYDFIDRGAEDEVTLRANSESIKRIYLRQRVGVDVAARDPSVSVFGVKQSMPVGVAATRLASLIHYDGERKLARAAAAAGVPFTIGTSNFTAQAELKEICGDLLWRLIYPNKRRDLTEYHLTTARDAGVSTIVITMDSAVTGNREYLKHNGFLPHGTNMRPWPRSCRTALAVRHAPSISTQRRPSRNRGYARRRAAILEWNLFVGRISR